MITVRFNDVEEFITELRQGQLLEKVLRITKQFEHSAKLPVVNVTVLASALRYVPQGRHRDPALPGVPQVLSLSRYCGQSFAHPIPGENKAIEKSDAVMKRLEEAAAELHLEVRAGVYEEGGAK